MRRRKHLVLVLALLALGLSCILFLSACGDDEPAETTAGPTTTAAGGGADMGEDIVIGAINSITGVNALTGAEQKWAQEKAAEDINAKGGIKLADGKMHKVVLKFMDDKSSDVEAAAAMEKLIKSEGLKINLSSNTTPYNQAAATVAEQYQAFFMVNTSWTDEAFFGGYGLKWSADIFESAADSGLVAMGAAKRLGENTPTKWAVMYENNPDGIGWGDGQKMQRCCFPCWTVLRFSARTTRYVKTAGLSGTGTGCASPPLEAPIPTEPGMPASIRPFSTIRSAA